MKRLILAVITAVALSGGAPSVGHAQTQTNGTGQATFGNLIAALNNITANINSVKALNNLTVSQVRVVNVQDVLNGNNVNALNNAINNNKTNINVLRDFLNNSANNNTVQVLNNALNGISVSRVVAINVLSGGDVILFYR